MSESARNRRGFQGILLATVIAGMAGYFVTWVVFRFAGSENYAQFAVFWSAFFLLVGGFAGVQQEFSRATNPVSEKVDRTVKRATGWKFACALAGTVVAIVVVSAQLWMPTLFRTDWTVWALPFAFGTVATILMSAVAGSLYGIRSWALIAVLIAIDAFLRVVAIGLVLALDAPVEVYGWAIVAPIPVTLVVMMPWLIRTLRRQTLVDTTHGQLWWNVSRTVVASLATGVLVSGFPAVLQATTQQANTAALGDLIFAVTLARAPLIVTVMALQSFLVVQFRNSPDSRRRRLIQISALVSGLTVAASAVTAVIGIPVLNFVANHVVVDNVVFIVGLVFSSGLVALLQVTGAFLIAESRHTAYFVGLALAACATFALLQADLSLTESVTLSLIGAPALGLVSHLLALIVQPTKTPEE